MACSLYNVIKYDASNSHTDNMEIRLVNHFFLLVVQFAICFCLLWGGIMHFYRRNSLITNYHFNGVYGVVVALGRRAEGGGEVQG